MSVISFDKVLKIISTILSILSAALGILKGSDIVESDKDDE